MKEKVIVIGAGPGGLTSAMLLAAQGYEVEIFEQKEYVGGRNGRISLGDYHFDIGPTFLMMLDVLQDVFTRTGRNIGDYLNIINIDPMYRLSFNGGEREFFPSRNRKKMEEEMERFSPGSYKGYLKYLEEESEKYDKLIPCLRVPYSSPTDFLSKKFITALPYLDAHKSLHKILGKYFNDELLKIAFTFQAKYIGMSPWEAPGTFSIISYIEHGGGIYHVEGGLNRISHAMAKIVEEEGGKIHLGKKVKNVIVENGTAQGVILEDGERVTAHKTIINADFAHAMNDIVEEKYLKKWTPENLKKKKYSCSTFMLYLGLDRTYDEIPHHNILFADDYKQNVDDIVGSKTLSEDFSVYIQNASTTDKTLAPEGHSAIYLLVPVPNNFSDINWEEEKDAFKEKVLDAVEQKGGLKDIRNHIKEMKMITPAQWDSEYSVYEGATFNLGHNIGQMLLFRPHNKFEEFKNCYLVGGGTHPGSGLPTIYESGRITAELIMK